MNYFNSKGFQAAFLGLAVLLLGGCNQAIKHDPAYAPIRPPVLSAPRNVSGSIYQAGYNIQLFEDLRARRVGDILTVQLVESTNSSKSATTDLSKSNTTSVTNPTILGTSLAVDVPGFLPLASTKGLGLGTSLASNHQFSGDGSSDQSNSLTGNISVTVVEVLPNGNLVIRGEKRLNLNQGNEYVRISGIVRSLDIDATNSVPSTKVADATIIYTGDGAVASTNAIGWLAKFFLSALLPF